MTSTEIKTGDPKLRAFIDDAIAEAQASIDSGSFINPLPDIAAVTILDEWRRGIGTVQQHHAILLAEGVLGVPFTAWATASDDVRQAAGWSALPQRELAVA